MDRCSAASTTSLRHHSTRHLPTRILTEPAIHTPSMLQWGLLSTWRMTCSLSPTVDNICCDLTVTEPVSFHGHITASATKAFLLPDPECGTLCLKNSDRTQASDSLGANWNRTRLSRLLNHSALWQIVFLRLINILTYLLTCQTVTLL